MKHVIIVGGGNAALCAAIAAAQSNSQVTLIEAATEEATGGNSRYTAGALRFSYANREEILNLLDDATHADERMPKTDFGSYPADKFLQELQQAAEGSGNLALHKLMAHKSYETMMWLKDSGVKWLPIYSRQAYKVDDKYVFWGGLTLAAEEEGEGLVQKQMEIAKGLGVKFMFNSPVQKLLYADGSVQGVVYKNNATDELQELQADAVVLACGGFEANSERREEHIGKGWSSAKVRGTKYNLGDGLIMAKQIGAKTCGNWGGCHAVFMDANSPDYGNLDIPHIERKNYRKISYPFGVMINREGKRFVDEGADFRNYTYAKYGKEVLAQTGGTAWQIFDAQVTELLYDEYNMAGATKISADNLPDLIKQMDDVDQEQALITLNNYNQAVDNETEFNPTIKDGKAAKSNDSVTLDLPKSNWATSLSTAPFVAYKVTCGITFTYGGLAIDEQARVLDENDKPIGGLYAAGEMVGDIFHHNYPGGSGLTSGAVFGKISGTSAAQSL